jgi:hypothetical protein
LRRESEEREQGGLDVMNTFIFFDRIFLKTDMEQGSGEMRIV